MRSYFQRPIIEIGLSVFCFAALDRAVKLIGKLYFIYTWKGYSKVFFCFTFLNFKYVKVNMSPDSLLTVLDTFKIVSFEEGSGQNNKSKSVLLCKVESYS